MDTTGVELPVQHDRSRGILSQELLPPLRRQRLLRPDWSNPGGIRSHCRNLRDVPSTPETDGGGLLWTALQSIMKPHLQSGQAVTQEFITPITRFQQEDARVIIQ
jgi:hypothetical protein